MSLFQKSVVNKYLTNLDSAILKKAYDQYLQFYGDKERIENIRLLNEENYQEGFLREIFVDVLGYTINPDKNYNLTTEYKNETDSRKADGAILLNGSAIGVIELKSTKTLNLESIREQAFSYKNHQPNCRFVITSNFEKLRLYIDNATDWEEFNLFSLDYENFKRFYLFLSKHSISVGITSKIKDESKLHEENISNNLYKDYSKFKTELHNELIKHNSAHDKLLLFHKSQKLLDRILFVLFAEDRLLIPPNTISEVINQWNIFKRYDEPRPLYFHFVKLFNHLDKGFKNDTYELHAYNGGLFKKDELLDNLIISDEVLHSNTIKLSKYGYNTEVDVNILGHIFENSITEIEQVKASLEGETAEKNRSRRKKEGIFYTPKYITKYIVDNTVGALCSKKKNELGIDEIENEIIENSRTSKGKLSKKAETLLQKLNSYRDYLTSLKILDPACGSGAFLNQALEFLIGEHELIDGYRRELEKDSLGLYDITKSILENNLYGVDINEEAVEIAKLSLWIRTAEPGRKLSDLSKNIKCGNSLINDPAVAGDKAFNWNKEFPEIMKNGGFDVVIGNPPYVFGGNEGISNQEKNYFKNNFETGVGKINLFTLFIEKAIKLLKINRRVSFIIPNTYLRVTSYEVSREFIIKNYTLVSIVDLGVDVFNSAVTSSIILTVSKNTNNKNNIILIHQDFISPPSEMNQNEFANKGDFILSVKTSKIDHSLIDKIKKSKTTLGDICKELIFGVVITKNRNDLVSDVFKPGLKKFLEGKDISRYIIWDSNKYLNYEPKKLHRPRTPEIFETSEKLLIQRITGGITPLKVAYDDKQFYTKESINNLILKDNCQFNIKYILCLLNSSLINWFYGTYFTNESVLTVNISKEYLSKIPIAECNKSDHNTLVSLADLMINNEKQVEFISLRFLSRIQSNSTIDKISNKLKEFYNYDFKTFLSELKKKKITLTLKQQDEWEQYFNEYKTEINKLQQQISQTDNEIDQLVYKLYGLTAEEIKIVEGNGN